MAILEAIFRPFLAIFWAPPGRSPPSAASRRASPSLGEDLEQKPVKDCPDNDAHNVDTIDGLVLPSVAAACAAYKGGPGAEGKAAARDAAVAVAATTRASRPLATAAAALGDAMHGAIHGVGSPSSRADAMASALGMRVPRQPTMVS